jgi:AAA domain
MDFVYGTDYPDAEWIDRDGQPLHDDPYWDVPPPDEPPADQEPAGDKTPVLADVLLTRSDLRDLPDPEPLIDNVLDQGTVALLYGRWGTYKSFIALDWAASVATGRAWQSRPTEQRRVLYIAAEGAFGLKGRVQAWEQGWHTTIADGDLDILPRPVNLTNAAETRNLAALIDWNGYGLVVLDTLARCMVGGDENSAQDCGLVVDALHRLRDCTPCGRGTVTGVHHTGKDGKTFRGSSVFEAGADTVYSTTLDGIAVILDREKRKDGPPVDNHRLQLDLIDGTGSGVIGVSRGVGQTGNPDVLLSHFKSHFAITGAYPTHLLEVAAMPKTTFYRALSELRERGDLVNTGTDKRPFYKLAMK